MVYRWIFLLAASILALSGCSSTIELSRTKGPYKAVLGTGDNGEAIEGKLNLIYEKKLRGIVNTPLLLGEKLIGFNTSRDRFLLLERENGSRETRIRKSKGLILTPIILDSLVILVKKVPLGEVQIINLFTGGIMSSRDLNDIRSGPINVGETVVFGTTAGIAAYSAADLELVWEQDLQEMVDIDPLVSGDKLYYIAGSNHLVAADVSGGGTVWSTELEHAVASRLNNGRYLYLGLSDGTMITVNNTNGDIKWQVKLERPIRGAITEVGDYLYFGCTDGKVYCLKTESGVKVWDYQTGGTITASPIVHGRAVIIGSHDRHLYSLDKKTGRLIDKQSLRGPVTQAAVADGKYVFAACGKNRLYCFEAY